MQDGRGLPRDPTLSGVQGRDGGLCDSWLLVQYPVTHTTWLLCYHRCLRNTVGGKTLHKSQLEPVEPNPDKDFALQKDPQCLGDFCMQRGHLFTHHVSQARHKHLRSPTWPAGVWGRQRSVVQRAPCFQASASQILLGALLCNFEHAQQPCSGSI